MPAYSVDFATTAGPRRLRFTLDGDRPLGAQVQQILEEMRQHGVVLSGGPADELGVFWDGLDLQLDRSPDALRLSPDRPLELRMRPRPPSPAATQAPSLARSAYAAPLAGATGALGGWLAASMLGDLGPWLASYRLLDVAAATLLGAGTGIGVRAASALRRGASVWLGGASGFAAGAAGGGVSAMVGFWLGEVLDPGYLLLRVIVWVLVAAGIGGALGLLDGCARRALDGAVFGTSAGAAGAFLFSLASPAEFWQAAAFTVVGAALGSGLHTPALRRGPVVQGADVDERRRMTLFRIRERASEDGGTRPRNARLAAVLRCDAGGCDGVPSPGGAPIQLSGPSLRDVRALRDDVMEPDALSPRVRHPREIRA